MCNILLKTVDRNLIYLVVYKDKDIIANIYQLYRNIINVIKLTEDIFSGSVLFLMIRHYNSFIFMNYLFQLDTSDLMFDYCAISFDMNVISKIVLIAFVSEVPKTI